jgi:hypothetical protein
MELTVRKNINIHDRFIQIEVPEALMGKEVEVIVKEIESGNKKAKLMDFFDQYNFDLSHLTFDREEIHER